jgi:hypothetical protein
MKIQNEPCGLNGVNLVAAPAIVTASREESRGGWLNVGRPLLYAREHFLPPGWQE